MRRPSYFVFAGVVAIAACTDVPVTPTPPSGMSPVVSELANAATCGEAECVPITAAFHNHFADQWCAGTTEAFYLPNEAHIGGGRGSWDGQGLAGTLRRNITVRSYRDNTGKCWNLGTPYTGYQFVYIYRERPSLALCLEDYCEALGGSHYSHFTAADCSGYEAFYLPNSQHLSGRRGSWDAQGVAGLQPRSITVYSYKWRDGSCTNAYPSGYTGGDFVYIYRPGSPPPPYVPPPFAGAVWITGSTNVYTGQSTTWSAYIYQNSYGPYTYRWWADGVEIPGGATVTHAFGAPAGTHTLKLEVTDSRKSVATYTQNIQTMAPPWTGSVAVVGQTYLYPYEWYTWTAQISGNPYAPFSYRWYVDGYDTGVTDASLTWNFSPSSSHDISVVVTDARESVRSAGIIVNVNTGTCPPGSDLNCAEVLRASPRTRPVTPEVRPRP